MPRLNKVSWHTTGRWYFSKQIAGKKTPFYAGPEIPNTPFGRRRATTSTGCWSGSAARAHERPPLDERDRRVMHPGLRPRTIAILSARLVLSSFSSTVRVRCDFSFGRAMHDTNPYAAPESTLGEVRPKKGPPQWLSNSAGQRSRIICPYWKRRHSTDRRAGGNKENIPEKPKNVTVPGRRFRIEKRRIPYTAIEARPATPS